MHWRITRKICPREGKTVFTRHAMLVILFLIFSVSVLLGLPVQLIYEIIRYVPKLVCVAKESFRDLAANGGHINLRGQVGTVPRMNVSRREQGRCHYHRYVMDRHFIRCLILDDQSEKRY